MIHSSNPLKAGFTLVELSIVLVILGLLVGGVLSGQSLIRAAELRSVSADTSRYMTAMHSFRDKYFAVPGDMPNATRFWGALSTSSVATCQNMEATGKATCDGNGDGLIDSNAVLWSERFRAWQHLANAGLIEGSYTGRTDSATSGSFVVALGKNTPASKMSDTLFRFVSVNTTTTTANTAIWFVGIPAGNLLEFRGSSSASTGSPALKPEEAWNIDVKMDDGRPGIGVITTHRNSTIETAFHGCVDGDDPAAAQYVVSNSAKVCPINIKL